MPAMKLSLAEEAVEHQRTSSDGDLFSDVERSFAADSWSIKSEYGSTFDDDHQRHADAIEALAIANLRPSFEYSSDKDEDEDGDSDEITSLLGLESYWDANYSEELANFREHGLSGEIWFGPEVMDTVVSWTKRLCIDTSRRRLLNDVKSGQVRHIIHEGHNLSGWSVLDLGTGNGILLQEFAKEGFYDLTGIDYSEGAIDLARGLADRDGFLTINFMVDDILDTKLKRQFQLVIDKGTLDAIGLHPDGPIRRLMYWNSVSKFVVPGGIFVITSCNSTKDELVKEAENFDQKFVVTSEINPEPNPSSDPEVVKSPAFQYIDHVRSYPTFMFGGVLGSHVATVAFIRN